MPDHSQEIKEFIDQIEYEQTVYPVINEVLNNFVNSNKESFTLLDIINIVTQSQTNLLNRKYTVRQ